MYFPSWILLLLSATLGNSRKTWEIVQPSIIIKFIEISQSVQSWLFTTKFYNLHPQYWLWSANNDLSTYTNSHFRDHHKNVIKFVLQKCCWQSQSIKISRNSMRVKIKIFSPINYNVYSKIIKSFTLCGLNVKILRIESQNNSTPHLGISLNTQSPRELLKP